MLRWAHQERCHPERRLAGYCIRYPKDEIPDIRWAAAAEPIRLGRAEVLAHGHAEAGAAVPLMIWAYGSTVKTCHEALALLGAAAGQVTLVNARFAKPVDLALLTDLARSHARILSVEDHALMGGFGSALAEAAVDAGIGLPITRLGVRDVLIPHASREQQLATEGLDPAGVLKRISELLGLQGKTIPFPRTG